MSNVKGVVSSWPEKFKNSLTLLGREQVKKAAQKLKTKHIDLIFASDLLRTRQTAEIVGKTLKLAPKFDKRLREVGFGTLNGKTNDLVITTFSDEQLRIDQKNQFGSELYKEVLERMTDFLKDVDSQYHGKSILVVSHQCPLWLVEDFVKGISLREDIKRNPEEKRINKGEIRELN